MIRRPNQTPTNAESFPKQNKRIADATVPAATPP